MNQLRTPLRRGLQYILPIFVVCLIVVGVWMEKHSRQRTFLEETNQYLIKLEHELDAVLDASYTEEADLSNDFNHIVDLMAALKTTIENGHHFVSETIPLPDEPHGFRPIMDAIKGNLSAEYGIAPFALGGISPSERTFLEALSQEVSHLKDATEGRGGWYRPDALKQFAAAYRLFEETWQLEGIRTPSGSSPFDGLQAD